MKEFRSFLSDAFGWFLAIAFIIGLALGEDHKRREAKYNCNKVYTGASAELCYRRVVNGGPVYEENIGKVK